MAKPDLNFDWHSWSDYAFEVGSKKMNEPRLSVIARAFYMNPTQAYRFAKILSWLKEKQTIKLNECPPDFPKSAFYEYLKQLVKFGLVVKNDKTSSYTLSTRFINPFFNFLKYTGGWFKKPFNKQEAEDLPLDFADAENKGKLREKTKGSGARKKIGVEQA